jgi:putative peptidoglycan lipid II flippase
LIRQNIYLSALQLVSLVVTLGAQMLIAQRIGPGLQLDAYFAVIGFAAALVGSIASGATYLLPARIRSAGNTAGQQAEIAGHGVLASSAVGIIVALTSAVFFLILMTEQQDLTVNYDILLVILGWLGALTSVLATSWGAVGNAHGKVIGAIIFSMLPPLSMAAYLLHVDSPTVLEMAGAQLIGICFQAISLAWLYRIHWSLARFDQRVVSRLVGEFPLAAAGTLCFSAYAAVDAWLAPSLGVGVMSHQSLAQRLVIAFSGVVSAGPFMLASSITANMLDEGRGQDVWKYTLRAGIILTLLCIIASAATLWIGQSVIGIVFQRGEFGPSDTQAVSKLVTILLVGAGPMLASAVAFRVLHNKGCSRYVAILSLAWIALYTSFANLFSTYFEYLSLSIAYVLAWSVIACGVYIALGRILKSTYNH